MKTTLDESLFVTSDRSGSTNGYPALNLAEASEHYFDRNDKSKAGMCFSCTLKPLPLLLDTTNAKCTQLVLKLRLQTFGEGPSFWGIGEFGYFQEPEDTIKSLWAIPS